MNSFMKRFTVLIVGIIFVFVGGFLYYKNSYLAKVCTSEVIATVVGMEERFSADEDGTKYTYYPVIEYKVGSETIKKTMSSGSNPPAYSINDTLTIYYNPNKIGEFYVKGDIMSNIFSYVFMGLGVLLTGYGIKVAIKGE